MRGVLGLALMAVPIGAGATGIVVRSLRLVLAAVPLLAFAVLGERLVRDTPVAPLNAIARRHRRASDGRTTSADLGWALGAGVCGIGLCNSVVRALNAVRNSWVSVSIFVVLLVAPFVAVIYQLRWRFAGIRLW